MPETFFRHYNRDDEAETEILVEIQVDGWGSAPSGLFGPPEDYDPGDGMEFSILKAWLKSDEDKFDAPEITLTDAERERIEIAFAEDPPEAGDGRYDYDD